MIEVLYADGASEILPSLTWSDIERILGGNVRRLEAWQTDATGNRVEPLERVDLIYNQKDFARGTPLNLAVIHRFGDELGLGAAAPRSPPGGNWVVASGRDRLPIAADDPIPPASPGS